MQHNFTPHVTRKVAILLKIHLGKKNKVFFFFTKNQQLLRWLHKHLMPLGISCNSGLRKNQLKKGLKILGVRCFKKKKIKKRFFALLTNRPGKKPADQNFHLKNS